jgi:hypothetical protein
MARGGKREGAGRPQGAVTKRSREVAERALAEGKTPLEVMLDNMRHFQQVALDAEATLEGLTVAEFTGKITADTPEEQFKALLAQVKKTAGFRQLAQESARDAAAYVHPRLAAVQHSGDMTVRHEDALDELDDEPRADDPPTAKD